MKISKRDGSLERKIVTSMVVDQIVLASIAQRWQPDLFRSKWSNLVGGWCVKYYLRYNKPPGKAIEGLYESWTSKANDQDTIQLVEKFLTDLSGEYEQLKKDSNSEWIIDQAANHFNQVRLNALAEQIQGDLDSGDLDAAQKRVASHGKIEMGQGAGIDVLHDMAAIQKAFEDKKEPLIKYPGALGKFMAKGDALERDGFIAFMGPEKVGKTFNLLDLSWRGMLQRHKVAFFAVGDMSQSQMMRRFMVRAARQPLRPQVVKYPEQIIRDQAELFAQVQHREIDFATGLDYASAMAAAQKVMTLKAKSNSSLLKLFCCPNSSLNVNGMRAILQGWDRQHDWRPDILVVDYADILAPPARLEGRDGINETWKQLRALSQEQHCLVVTATQANAASYSATIVDRRNFSEDKRKLAHVTGMIGLSTTPEEKEQGIIRWNWVELREGEFSDRHCCHVASCLALANPAVKSCF